MIPLDLDKRRRLIASARLLESDKKGERHAALEAVLRLLPTGVTLAGILERAFRPVEPASVILLFPWQRQAEAVCNSFELFSDQELDFALTMRERRTVPTKKQWEWLSDLAARVQERAAA